MFSNVKMDGAENREILEKNPVWECKKLECGGKSYLPAVWLKQFDFG